MKTRSKLLILIVGLVLLGILSVMAFSPKSSENRARSVVDAFFLALKQKRLEDAYHILNPPGSIMSFDDFKKSKLANYKIKDWKSNFLSSSNELIPLCGDFTTETEDGWRRFQGSVADQGNQFSTFSYSDYLSSEPANQNVGCVFW